jgi:hypothetical protein
MTPMPDAARFRLSLISHDIRLSFILAATRQPDAAVLSIAMPCRHASPPRHARCLPAYTLSIFRYADIDALMPPCFWLAPR